MNGLGCTWDKELAYLQGVVEGREARVLGYTNVYAPILDVARDQRWGRWEGTIAVSYTHLTLPTSAYV